MLTFLLGFYLGAGLILAYWYKKDLPDEFKRKALLKFIYFMLILPIITLMITPFVLYNNRKNHD